MGDTSAKFGGLVVASLAGVVGTKYLLGGTLASAGAEMVDWVLVSDSVAATLAVGVVLYVVAAALATGFVLARPMSVMVFGGVILGSLAALLAGNIVIIAESVGMGLSILYLLARSPIERVEQAHIDESDSATRHGSTLR